MHVSFLAVDKVRPIDISLESDFERIFPFKCLRMLFDVVLQPDCACMYCLRPPSWQRCNDRNDKGRAETFKLAQMGTLF